MDTPNEIFVPMPEGFYEGTYRRDGDTWWVEVPGGIVHNGKGEEAYDLGLDASSSASGSSVPAALVNLVEGVMQRRRQYGPPDGVITRPVSLKEAIEIHGDRRLGPRDRI